MAYQYVFVTKELGKIYPPGRQVLRDISLSFLPGAKIGVIGANGSGKSTLLRIMAGLDHEFVGEAKAAEGVKVGYLPQEPMLDPSRSVIENIEDGVREVRTMLERYGELGARMAEPMDEQAMEKLLEEYGALQDRIEAAEGWEVEHRIEVAVEALRVPINVTVEQLSGGERRRAALCRLLLSHPDLLLLDEPTNHLDAESVAWLENYLKDYPGTVIAITHDRYFLDNVAQWILELDRGAGIPYHGNYSSWLEQKSQRLAVEEKQESGRQRALARELEWARMAPRARHAKSKARLAAVDRMAARQGSKTPDIAEITIPPGKRLGALVVEAKNLGITYSERVLIDDLSFLLPAGGIVGVIGANGAGKTSLFRVLAGIEPPDRGTIRLGETVEFAYVDQLRDALDPTRSVWEEISGGAERMALGDREVASRAYVASFNFKGADQQKRVSDLSGGERNRVHLAKLLRRGGNLLLLDEPTNDLDVDTLRALEEALLDFPGCAVVISHDRWFLDRVATHMLAFEGDSQVVWFEGNYQDYEADRRRRLGAAAEQPHRLRFKKLRQ